MEIFLWIAVVVAICALLAVGYIGYKIIEFVSGVLYIILGGRDFDDFT